MIDFRSTRETRASAFDYIQVRIASPEEIRGDVTVVASHHDCEPHVGAGLGVSAVFGGHCSGQLG